MEKSGLAPGADPSKLKFTADLQKAVEGSDLIQENGPERVDFKKELYKRLDDMLPQQTIIASSSSGLTMSSIQIACTRFPDRCVIAHPFNPPHLIPLVEIVGGEKTSEETIARAQSFYDGLGKTTIRLFKEVPGHVANRLQAALYREIVHLISDGVVSVADADAAVCWGPGLRWGIMGPSLLYHLGGGQGGIEHFFDQFTGPMTALWKDMGSPELGPDVRQKIVDGVHEIAAARSINELAERRDEMLMSLLAARQS